MAILGMAMLGEPATGPRVFFLALLLIAIIGLKFTAQRTRQQGFIAAGTWHAAGDGDP